MAVTLDEASRRRVLAAAERVAQLVGSPRPILEAMGLEVLAWIDRNFDQGGDPAWAPLAPSTLASRQADGAGTGSPTPLKDVGTLRASFSPQVNPKLLTDDTIEVGSDDRRAVWHHYGTQPYEIRPKTPGGVLAFPAVVAGASGAILPQRSGAGLGRAKALPGGSFIVPAGRTVRGRKPGQRVLPFKNVAFARSVKHPGLTPRPLLPRPDQIVPRLVAIAEAAARVVAARA